MSIIDQRSIFSTGGLLGWSGWELIIEVDAPTSITTPTIADITANMFLFSKVISVKVYYNIRNYLSTSKNLGIFTGITLYIVRSSSHTEGIFRSTSWTRKIPAELYDWTGPLNV